jgi:hypothetical protein
MAPGGEAGWRRLNQKADLDKNSTRHEHRRAAFRSQRGASVTIAATGFESPALL